MPSKTAARISVGIGSWTDKEYAGVLYPKGLPDTDRLRVYATRFGHIEVNSSYHRIPPVAFVRNWVKLTPTDFLFDFKLHRRFSQSPAKAAADPRLMKALRTSIAPIVAAGRLGTFFLVMPPRFGPETRALEELDTVVEKLKPHRLAVELRHSDWVTGAQREKTFQYFRDRGLIWIATDMPRIKESTIMPPMDVVTNPELAYLRLHGRRKDWLELESAEARHTYAYSDRELREIVRRVRALTQSAREVRVVANNHAQDFAPQTALALQKMLGLRGKISAVSVPTVVRDKVAIRKGPVTRQRRSVS